MPKRTSDKPSECIRPSFTPNRRYKTQIKGNKPARARRGVERTPRAPEAERRSPLQPRQAAKESPPVRDPNHRSGPYVATDGPRERLEHPPRSPWSEHLGGDGLSRQSRERRSRFMQLPARIVAMRRRCIAEPLDRNEARKRVDNDYRRAGDAYRRSPLNAKPRTMYGSAWLTSSPVRQRWSSHQFTSTKIVGLLKDAPGSS